MTAFSHTETHQKRGLPRWLPLVSCLVLLCLFAQAGEGAECGITSVGLVPLNDLGTGTYQGYQGGLYPGGSNAMPAAHLNAGLAIASALKPLDAEGNVDEANGVIAMASIGMSNTMQEFGQFMTLVQNAPGLNARLVLVNGAESGQTAVHWIRASGQAWSHFAGALSAAGVTPEQVQVVWIKLANRGDIDWGPFPGYAVSLRDHMYEAVRTLKDLYPNVQMAFLSSRIYAGYAGDYYLNPEPLAYESGLSVKWLIQQQMDGDQNLNYDPANGTVEAPWMAWGTYLWADGLGPDGVSGGIPGRSDGLEYECGDLRDDGTHPSPGVGTVKVANLLMDFFRTDPTATPWFLAASSTYQCSDGLDNDGDGLTDYPSDPGCTADTDNSEVDAPTADTTAPSPPTELTIESPAP